MNLYQLSLKRDHRVRFVRDRVYHAADTAEVLHALTADAAAERFCVVCLNGQNQIIATGILGLGGLHGCAIQARDVLSFALLARAHAVIVGHNHPSGDPSPSPDDISLTRALKAACEVVGVPLLDHVVVAVSTTGEKLHRSLM